MKRHNLKKLRLDELSLVDSPACSQARVVLHKRDEGNMSWLDKIKKAFGGTAPTRSQLDAALTDAVSSIQKDTDISEEEREALLKSTLNEYGEAVQEIPTPDEEEYVDLTKGASERIEKAEREAAEVREELRKFKAERDNERRLSVAKSLTGDIPVAPEKVAYVLGQLDTEGTATVSQLLKAHNAIIKSAGLMSEIGTTGGDATDADEFDKAVADVRKAHPTLTQAQAVTKALELNPDLYEG